MLSFVRPSVCQMPSSVDTGCRWLVSVVEFHAHVTAQRRYETSTVRNVHGWYEKSVVRNVHGTKRPRMVRVVRGTKRPRYEKSTYGTKRLWYE